MTIHKHAYSSATLRSHSILFNEDFKSAPALLWHSGFYLPDWDWLSPSSCGFICQSDCVAWIPAFCFAVFWVTRQTTSLRTHGPYTHPKSKAWKIVKFLSCSYGAVRSYCFAEESPRPQLFSDLPCSVPCSSNANRLPPHQSSLTRPTWKPKHGETFTLI